MLMTLIIFAIVIIPIAILVVGLAEKNKKKVCGGLIGVVVLGILIALYFVFHKDALFLKTGVDGQGLLTVVYDGTENGSGVEYRILDENIVRLDEEIDDNSFNKETYGYKFKGLSEGITYITTRFYDIGTTQEIDVFEVSVDSEGKISIENEFEYDFSGDYEPDKFQEIKDEMSGFGFEDGFLEFYVVQ